MALGRRLLLFNFNVKRSNSHSLQLIHSRWTVKPNCWHTFACRLGTLSRRSQPNHRYSWSSMSRPSYYLALQLAGVITSNFSRNVYADWRGTAKLSMSSTLILNVKTVDIALFLIYITSKQSKLEIRIFKTMWMLALKVRISNFSQILNAWTIIFKVYFPNINFWLLCKYNLAVGTLSRQIFRPSYFIDKIKLYEWSFLVIADSNVKCNIKFHIIC